jgi:hypothetical protein
MTNTFDVVAMGAGHNGLVAAAYLAKAGKKVLVLERKAWPGGGVVTRELNTPGYWHDEHSSVHIMIQGNPMIRRDELGLQSKFGLEYRYGIPYAMIFPDQISLVAYQDLDKTCEGIAKISAATPRPIDTSPIGPWRCCPCSPRACIRRRLRWESFTPCWTAATAGAKCWTPCSAVPGLCQPVLRKRKDQNLAAAPGIGEPAAARRIGHRLRLIPHAGVDARLWRVAARRRQRQALRVAGPLYRALWRRGSLQQRGHENPELRRTAPPACVWPPARKSSCQRRRDRRHSSASPAQHFSTAYRSRCWAARSARRSRRSASWSAITT